MTADGVREAFWLARALAVYRGAVLPRVAAGLRHWQAAATEIPDPELRRQALTALHEKSSNVEATAVFATLAPRQTRPAAVAAMTALQVAVDYLDTLGEQPAADPLASGLALHGALAAAIDPDGPVSDWYRRSPWEGDGGYLDALVAGCREAMAALPAAESVRAQAVDAARRCGEGQSHTHTAELAGQAAAEDASGTGTATAPAELETWARSLQAPAAYEWWELAAGASSSVAVHALIATAADPRTSASEAEAIDAAYFPPIGALTVILDDLVDRGADLATGAHDYTAYYEGPERVAERLAWIAAQARSAIAGLPRARGHAAILDGVLGYYLGDPGARTEFARPAREKLKAGAARVVLIAAITGLQQRRERSGDDGSASGPSASTGRSAREESGRP